MLQTVWNWLKELNTRRASRYPSETVTITCSCGFHSEMNRDTFVASFGDRTITEIGDELERKCCERTGVKRCNLIFYEIAVPSFYR